MKKQMTPNSIKNVLILLALVATSLSFGQVGINTVAPANGSILDIESANKGIFIPRVSIIDLTTINPVTGISGPVEELAAAGLLVYNTFAGTGTGFYFWNGTDWAPISASSITEPPIDSVSLATDQSLNTAAYTDIPGMTLTFTARKASVLIQMTASGFGSINSLSIANLRVFNTTSSTVIGGTMEKVQSFYDPSGPGAYQVTTWSAGYSKLLTGLTIGATYSIKVQGFCSNASPSGAIVIQPASNPDDNHLTLSVIQ